MAYNVIWSKEAEDSYINVVDDLLYRWPPKTAKDFIDRTERLIAQIKTFPYLFRAYENNAAIRHGILHKNITMFYKVDEAGETIKIMLFWANRVDPNKLKLE